MQQSMKQLGIWTLTIVLGIITLSHGRIAAAQEKEEKVAAADSSSSATNDCPAEKLVTVVGKSSTRCIPVHHEIWTKLHIPKEARVSQPKAKDSRFKIRWIEGRPKVDLKAVKGAQVGDETTFKVVGPYEATIVLRIVAKPSMARGDVELEHITEEEGEIRALKEEAAEAKKEVARSREEIAKAREEYAKERRQFDDRLVKSRRQRDYLARKLAERERKLAEKERKLAENAAKIAKLEARIAGLESKLTEANTRAENNLIKGASRGREQAEFEMLVMAGRELLDPQSHKLYPSIRNARLPPDSPLSVQYDSARWQKDVLLVAMDLGVNESTPYRLAPPQVRDLSGKAFETEVIHPVVPEDPAQGIIRRISQGNRTKIVIAITGAAGVPAGELQLQLSEPNGSRSVVAAMPRFEGIGYPESEEKERRRLWSTKVIVSAGYLAGAFWIAGPEDNQTDAAAFQGFGLRITKGVSEILALEGEAAGAKTGDAQFEDMTRTATLGRLQFGLLARLGYKIIPILRAGAGLQVTRYRTQHGMGEAEPSTKVEGMWYFGAGMDYRIQDSVVVGISGTYDKLVSSDSQLLYANLHVSVGF